MEAALQHIIERAIQTLAPDVQAQCNKAHIERQIERLGVRSVDDARAIATGDFQLLTAALHPIPMMFAIRLKGALGEAAAASAVPPPPATPGEAAFPGANFQTPGSGGSAGTPPPAVNSVVVTVTVVGQAAPPVRSRIIAVAATTSFAELHNLAVADLSASERETLATLPVKVATYTGPHPTAPKADATLTSLVTASTLLGYKHVVFAHAAPAQRPAPRPSENVFERMKSGAELPDRHSGDELSFEKALFNWLRDQCQADGLGVRRDELEECGKLLANVRDALQAIDGREGQYRYSRVPEGFKAYKSAKPPIKRAKKPANKSLDAKVVRGYADKLRGAIDRNAFTRSDLWKPFVGDCEELYAVLMLKYDDMRGHSAAQAERRADPTVCSAPPPSPPPCPAPSWSRRLTAVHCR